MHKGIPGYIFLFKTITFAHASPGALAIEQRNVAVQEVASAWARVGVARCRPPPARVGRVPAAGAKRGGSSQLLAGN